MGLFVALQYHTIQLHHVFCLSVFLSPQVSKICLNKHFLKVVQLLIAHTPRYINIFVFALQRGILLNFQAIITTVLCDQWHNGISMGIIAFDKNGADYHSSWYILGNVHQLHLGREQQPPVSTNKILSIAIFRSYIEHGTPISQARRLCICKLILFGPIVFLLKSIYKAETDIPK